LIRHWAGRIRILPPYFVAIEKNMLSIDKNMLSNQLFIRILFNMKIVNFYEVVLQSLLK
jgi:hypothetical protein